MANNEIAIAFSNLMEQQNVVFAEMFCRFAAFQEYLESRDPHFASEFQKHLENERKKAKSAFATWQDLIGGQAH
jgi:hypothetical protein